MIAHLKGIQNIYIHLKQNITLSLTRVTVISLKKRGNTSNDWQSSRYILSPQKH